MKSAVGKPAEIPNPDLIRFQTWAVLPFCLELEQGTTSPPRSFVDWFNSEEPSGPLGTPEGADGWRLLSPEEFSKDQMDRWYVHEVHSLFYKQEKGQSLDRRMPKFRWLTCDAHDSMLTRLLKDHRLALLLYRKSRNRSGAKLRILPQSLKMELSALVSVSGIVLFMVRFFFTGPGKINLADAMLLNHILAYPNTGAVALVPRGVIRHAETVEDSRLRELRVTLEELKSGESCIPIHLDKGPVLESWQTQMGVAAPLSSVCVEMLASAMKATQGVRPYVIVRGRVPLYTQYLLPDLRTPDGSLEDQSSLLDLEARAARCHRHPRDGGTRPPSLEHLGGPEFHSMRISSSQRLHVSSEGTFAWGHRASGYDQTSFHKSIAGEFLLTYLLAQHQAAACLDLSWRSYTRKDKTRDNESLVDQFLEYNTEYDFAVISNQMNIQRYYRLCREALGVASIGEDVRQELSSWQENESRKEQGSLNSIAVIALMGAFATFLVGLNLSPINTDSGVKIDISKAVLPWFFWGPLILVGVTTAIALVRGNLKRHVKRLWRLIVG